MLDKTNLIKTLKSLNIPFAEGIQNDKDTQPFPRLVLFEIAWDDISASSNSYETVVTYQISFYAEGPRDSKLLELRRSLINLGHQPFIQHELIDKPRKHIHSFFALDVIESLNLDNA